MGHRFQNYQFKFLLVLFTIIGCAISTFGQGELTISEILRSNLPAENSLPYSDNLSFINGKAKGLPLLENLQFRTETDEFTFDQQEYLLRFNLNSTEERKAYDKVLSTNQAIYTLKQEEYISETMQDVYQAVVSYYFDMKKLEVSKNNLLVLRDKKKVISKLLASSDKVNINNWLSNQDDIVSESSDSLSFELSLDKVESKYFLIDEQLVSVSFDDFITIDRIEQVAIEYLSNLAPNTSVKLAYAEENNARAEFDLEKAETEKIIDFFQVRYQADRDVSFQKELAFSSSINIPTNGTNRMKKNEAALEVWDKKYNRILEEEKINERIYSNILNLNSAISKYRALEKVIKDQKLEETYSEYVKIGNASPLTLLGIQKNINRYQNKLLGAKENVYEAYLEVLEGSSLYGINPKKNYLSNSVGDY